MSDMSVSSSEHRQSTPFGQCTDTTATTVLEMATVKNEIDAITKNIVELHPPVTAGGSDDVTLSTTNSNVVSDLGPAPATTDAAYIDEIYTKISEYYRGIFSSIDLKDPNINADVLNYYQLIRQFYEQTMAANIQRNTANGLSSLALPSDISKNYAPSKNAVDVSTIDLTISKPTIVDTFSNANANSSFQNNININIENNLDVPKVRQANLIAKSNDEIAENKVTISSAGVSINVSSTNSNSLKISCKTTPPKKRYSIYNHSEDAIDCQPSTTKSQATTPINLNTKFNVDSLMANSFTDKRNAIAESPLAKANATVDAIRNASAIDSNKNSPVTSVDSSGSITDIIPITSTYLQLMRSMGFSEEDALKFDNMVSTNLF